MLSKINQAALAEMVGTTRARQFFMNKFRRQGFIKYDGRAGRHLEVHSSLLNVLVYDDPSAARDLNDF